MMLSRASIPQCCGLALLVFAWSSTAVPAGTAGRSAAKVFQERSDVLIPRKWSIDCAREKADTDLIKTELKNAKRISTYGHDHIDDNSDDTKHYLEAFVSENLRKIGNNYIVEQLQKEYGNGADILGDSNKYTVKVTCDNNSDKCKKGYYAHMNDRTKTMNICDAWFDPKGTPAEKLDPPAPYLEKTEDIVKTCKKETETKFKTLENFWAGKAQALLHEVTHTKYFTGSEKTLDYCYGVQNALNLAKGSYKVGKSREYKSPDNPLCPDPNDPTKPGYCNADLSVDNADTLAILAGAMFWSAKDQCDRSIDIAFTAVDQGANAQDVPHVAYDEPENDPQANT
ncbi:MAG: hypothetical protein Q9221_006846 [Calogaya cf. arnoldii]